MEFAGCFQLGNGLLGSDAISVGLCRMATACPREVFPVSRDEYCQGISDFGCSSYCWSASSLSISEKLKLLRTPVPVQSFVTTETLKLRGPSLSASGNFPEDLLFPRP